METTTPAGLLDNVPQLGLLGSARAALAGLVEIGHTRLQLAATEFEEERLRIAELLLYACAALFFLGLGLVLAALLLVLVFWESHRVLVLAMEAAVFLALAAALAGAWRRKARAKPKLLATTLAELQRDRIALAPGETTPP
jgi:uncharacterized membrane protein YqjE